MITLTTPVTTATATKHSLPKRSKMAAQSRPGWPALGDPTVHTQALGRGALLVVQPCGAGDSAEPGVVVVEVRPVLLAVAALVRAAGWAQAVCGGAAHVLPGGRGLLSQSRGLGHETGRAPRGRSTTVPWRWDRLRLDVDIMVGADRQVGTLR